MIMMIMWHFQFMYAICSKTCINICGVIFILFFSMEECNLGFKLFSSCVAVFISVTYFVYDEILL
jgi:hypothetical protein